MRLIDADELLKRIEKSQHNYRHKNQELARCHDSEHRHFMKMVLDMATMYADVVEVVRCKNCKYRDNGENLPICIIDAGDNDYCSWGEPREDGEA